MHRCKICSRRRAALEAKRMPKRGEHLTQQKIGYRLVDIGHGNRDIGVGELALVLLCIAVLSVENVLAVLVHLDLRDDAVARVNANRDRDLIGLLAIDALDVDYELLPVARQNLALALVLAAHDAHLVVLADWQRADAVLLAQLGAQRRGHDHAAHGRRRREVRLAALPPRGSDGV